MGFKVGDEVRRITDNFACHKVGDVDVITAITPSGNLKFDCDDWFSYNATNYELVTPRTPHKHCELIKMWADGHAIQYYNKLFGKWLSTGNPCWDIDIEYRATPHNELKLTELRKQARELADEITKLENQQ